MMINVLFFGATAETLGSRGGEVEVMNGENIDSFIKRLKEENPRLAKHRLLVAVNQEYVEFPTDLKDGDELAIFTAVSGG